MSVAHASSQPRNGSVVGRSVNRDRLHHLDVARMLNTRPPPVPYVTGQLLASGKLTMLSGREGEGKSLLALTIAAAVGTGAPVAGMLSQPGTALVIDAENGEEEAHRRVHGLQALPDALAYVEARDGFDLCRHFAELSTVVRREQPDVLVLDAFRSLCRDMDENDSGAVEGALGPLRSLIREVRCATLLLHHASKGSGEYRGSSAIGAAVDLGYALGRAEGDSGSRVRRRLRCTKNRLGPEPDPIWLEFREANGRLSVVTAEPVDEASPAPSAPVRLGVGVGRCAEGGKRTDGSSGTRRRRGRRSGKRHTQARPRPGPGCGRHHTPRKGSVRSVRPARPDGRTDGRKSVRPGHIPRSV